MAIYLIKVRYLEEWLPRWLSGKESTRQCRRIGVDSWVKKIPWRRELRLTPHSCLENYMDTEVWQATVHGFAKSQTRLTD